MLSSWQFIFVLQRMKKAGQHQTKKLRQVFFLFFENNTDASNFGK